MKIAKDFRLVGLSRLHNEHYMAATVEPFGSSDTMQALIEGDNSFKDALWNYCEGNWGNLKAICVTDEDDQLWVHKVEHINA
jgi:hypothetical protein